MKDDAAARMRRSLEYVGLDGMARCDAQDIRAVLDRLVEAELTVDSVIIISEDGLADDSQLLRDCVRRCRDFQTKYGVRK